MPRDPVCGTALEEKAAKSRNTREGETYPFYILTLQKKIQKTTNEIHEVDGLQMNEVLTDGLKISEIAQFKRGFQYLKKGPSRKKG